MKQLIIIITTCIGARRVAAFALHGNQRVLRCALLYTCDATIESKSEREAAACGGARAEAAALGSSISERPMLAVGRR